MIDNNPANVQGPGLGIVLEDSGIFVSSRLKNQEFHTKINLPMLYCSLKLCDIEFGGGR